ncbi:MAG: maltose ABC transporter permease MalF [Rhodoferax sp.]
MMDVSRAWQMGLRVAMAALAVAALYLVVLLHGVGEPGLAAALLLVTVLAAWVYGSARTHALRYLFPGVAAAMVFVVFPMVYTVQIGFTNYSSHNLLDFERVQRQHLEETAIDPDAPRYALALYAQGAQFRLLLRDEGGRALLSPALDLRALAQAPASAQAPGAPQEPLLLQALEAAPADLGEPLGMKEVIAHQGALKALTLQPPQGTALRMDTLRSFAPVQRVYQREADGALRHLRTGQRLQPNFSTGFFETAEGEKVMPGFKVYVGLEHYRRIFSDPRFREPFVRIFAWTVAFAGLTVLFTAALGVLLAVLLSWENLRFRGVFRFVLFLPYAVPGFISILVFRGLFNQNLGEINLVLQALFGVKPAWFSDPLLAKAMLLIVNTWLGFPYVMIVGIGLIKSIPSDLYEASAVAGAGPLTNFFRITLPLILPPLAPLLISSFAFNFNNFVLIALLTGGRPDYMDTSVPAGTTDILVSYTFRMAFQDSGQQFGLASAISTVIFFIVALITLVQMRLARVASPQPRA